MSAARVLTSPLIAAAAASSLAPSRLTITTRAPSAAAAADAASPMPALAPTTTTRRSRRSDMAALLHDPERERGIHAEPAATDLEPEEVGERLDEVRPIQRAPVDRLEADVVGQSADDGARRRVVAGHEGR